MNCPDNHVLMSVSPVLKRKYASGASSVGISGTCCPLPAEDILLDEKVSSFTDCPDNFIVTGVFPEKPLPKCEAAREDPLNGALSGLCSLSAYKTKTKLLCTKIDSKRYKLGPVTTGLHKAMSGHLGELFSDDFTSWKQIPVALRYGLGRLTRSLWTESNCVGFPWGSIFVGKDGKYCSEIKFRQLLFQGLPQDPPADTPVKMFPDCLRLDDPLSEFPKCLKLEK